MQHLTWDQFIAMGGFAVYVWTAYGFALAMLLGNVLLPLRRRKRVLRELRRFLQFEERDSS
ncbi:MAG TPA: heme exporter protein CcmD [Acidiferrobacteraceae bacterium]|nr:heme exporter protein CcmD [Acidiferrobacteraceae bacterium]